MSRLSSASVISLLRNVCSMKPRSRCVLPRRPYSHNANDLQPKVTTTDTSSSHSIYRNEIKPSGFDKRVLLLSGRYKKKEDIPEYVSSETMSAARSNLRVKVCMAMIVGTVIGCILMVRSGKKALREDNTLLQKNIDRKIKWNKEAEKEAAQASSLKNH